MKKKQKGTIIRPGQRKPFRKCTNEEMERRLCIVENVIRQNPIRKNAIRKWIEEKFNLTYRQADEYISRARLRLMQRLKKPVDDHRMESLAFYEGVINSKFTTTMEKLKARRRIDQLLALDAPVVTKMEHSGEMKTSISQSISDLKLDLETKKKLLLAYRNKQVKKRADVLPFPMAINE